MSITELQHTLALICTVLKKKWTLKTEKNKHMYHLMLFKIESVKRSLISKPNKKPVH